MLGLVFVYFGNNSVFWKYRIILWWSQLDFMEIIMVILKFIGWRRLSWQLRLCWSEWGEVNWIRENWEIRDFFLRRAFCLMILSVYVWNVLWILMERNMFLLIVTCKFINSRTTYWVLEIRNKSVVLSPSLKVDNAVHYCEMLWWAAHLLDSQRYCWIRKKK